MAASTALHQHDTDIERLVLACVLLNPDVLDTPAGILPRDAFYNEAHRKLYTALDTTYRAHGCADVTLVAAQAARDGLNTATIDLASILASDIVMDSPTFTSAYFAGYAAELRRHYAARERTRAALEYQVAIRDGADETEARVILDAILDSLDDLDPDTLDDDAILDTLGSNARLPTGIIDIDTAIGGGMAKPGLNILAARPSVGKSALARGIIRNVVREGHRVFWYSVDQSAGQIYQLEIARALGRDTTHVANLGKEELRAQLTHVRDRVWRGLVTLTDTPLSLPKLLSHARVSSPDLVVIDYLQIVNSGAKDDTPYQAVTRVSIALKHLAFELGVPVLALAQLNRNAARPGPPSLAELKESGQIEQDADQVWALERTDEAVMGGGLITNLHVLKNKTGPTGMGRLVWHPKTAHFDGMMGGYSSDARAR